MQTLTDRIPTQPLEALKVVEAWGFRLMTMKGFTWNKCGSRQTDKLVMGMGHMTRANSEDCLFAVKGNLPERINAGIVQSFTAPRLVHSQKPDFVREKLVQLLGDVPRISEGDQCADSDSRQRTLSYNQLSSWGSGAGKCDYMYGVQPCRYFSLS